MTYIYYILTLYSVHCIICNFFNVLYFLHGIICIVFYALYSMHCSMCVVHCIQCDWKFASDFMPAEKLTNASDENHSKLKVTNFNTNLSTQ